MHGRIDVVERLFDADHLRLELDHRIVAQLGIGAVGEEKAVTPQRAVSE